MTALHTACAERVLTRFGMPSATPHALGNHGGFSGAALWRVETPANQWCLKAWPVSFEVEHLRHAHWLMKQGRAAGLDFVPRPHDSADGAGCVTADGHVWDLTSWQPGRADFHSRPSENRIEAACMALAELHRAWRPAKPQIAAVPSIRRRLAAAEQWHTLVRSGWEPDFANSGHPALAAWTERAWVILGYAVRRVPVWLAGWADVRLPLQPCLCDVWHDHVLFTSDDVTGIVDFGSVKIDHPAVDLARLLGSLVEDDRDLRDAGLDGYDRRNGLSREERALVDVLDRTGTVLSLTNWLRWIYDEGRKFPDRERIANRVAALVRRIEDW